MKTPGFIIETQNWSDRFLGVLRNVNKIVADLKKRAIDEEELEDLRLQLWAIADMFPDKSVRNKEISSKVRKKLSELKEVDFEDLSSLKSVASAMLHIRTNIDKWIRDFWIHGAHHTDSTKEKASKVKDSRDTDDWKDKLRNWMRDTSKEWVKAKESEKIIEVIQEEPQRVLPTSETYGLVRVNIIASKYSMTPMGESDLRLLGCELQKVHGRYMLIKHAWLLGLSIEKASTLASSYTNAMAAALKTVEQNRKLPAGNGMAFASSIRKIHGCYYAVVVPHETNLNDRVKIGSWDLAPGAIIDKASEAVSATAEVSVAETGIQQTAIDIIVAN